MSNKNSSTYLAELMMDVLPKAMQKIREEMRQGRGDLTVSQFRLLASVNRGICNNKELGDRLGVSEAAISRMLDILVHDGLIKKDVSKTDRRQKELTLSPKGQKLYSTIRTDARAQIKNKFESLSEADVLTVVAGLEVLQKIVVLLGD